MSFVRHHRDCCHTQTIVACDLSNFFIVFRVTFKERQFNTIIAGLFQLLDKVESLKLDIYPRELIPGELSRSVTLELFKGIHLPIASRVDAAISKLIWVSKGSHKSHRDLRLIYRSSNSAEQSAIREASAELQFLDLLDEVLREADEPIE